MVVNEKSEYSCHGVHKGAIGVIMTNYSIDGNGTSFSRTITAKITPISRQKKIWSS